MNVFDPSSIPTPPEAPNSPLPLPFSPKQELVALARKCIEESRRHQTPMHADAVLHSIGHRLFDMAREIKD